MSLLSPTDFLTPSQDYYVKEPSNDNHIDQKIHLLPSSTKSLWERIVNSISSIFSRNKTNPLPNDTGAKKTITYTDTNDLYEQLNIGSCNNLNAAQKKTREAFKDIVTKHSSKTVDYCSDEVIPVSDKIAIYRNGYNLTITAVSLVLIGLALLGVASPVTLGLIGIGISILAIGILIALVKAKKIDKKDAYRLAFMTIASTFSLFYGGPIAQYALLGIYALSVMFQGILFAGPQGLMAWGKGGYNKYQIAKEVGDKKHMISAAFGMNSGAMSAIEGTVWVFMGLLMLTACLNPLTASLHQLFPIIRVIPQLLPKVLPYITTGLFLGIFNLGYTFMIGTGYRDLKIQQTFQKKINGEFKNKNRTDVENCKETLNLLKRKLLGRITQKGGTKVLITDDVYNNNKNLYFHKWLKKANRLKKVMDDNAFDNLTLENIDFLTKKLNEYKELEQLQKDKNTTNANIKTLADKIDSLTNEINLLAKTQPGDDIDKTNTRISTLGVKTTEINDAKKKMLELNDNNARLKVLEDDPQVTQALEISQLYIRDIISANERNMKASRAQIIIGLAGLFIGSFVSMFEEFANPGSIIPHMPYIGHIATLSKAALAAISSSSTITDCALWAYINHCFKKYLDMPAGRMKDNEKLKNLRNIHELKQTDKLKIKTELEKIANEAIEKTNLKILNGVGDKTKDKCLETIKGLGLEKVKNHLRSSRTVLEFFKMIEGAQITENLEACLDVINDPEKLKAYLEMLDYEKVKNYFPVPVSA